jgi:hypothetical protein
MWMNSGAEISYTTFLNRAREIDNLFNCFKSMPDFNTVTGISEPLHGLHCAKKVADNPTVNKNLGKFSKNDICKPPTFSGTPSGLKVACDTLRFAETVSEIETHIGDMNGKTVMELGSNYGGLAYCMLTQWPDIKAYHILDLPPVQMFSLRYLMGLGVDMSKIITKPPASPVDLFISEYTMTEFSPDMLFLYYKAFGMSATNIYIRDNIPQPIRRTHFHNVLRETFNLLTEEEPPCRTPNMIVIGKRD